LSKIVKIAPHYICFTKWLQTQNQLLHENFMKWVLFREKLWRFEKYPWYCGKIFFAHFRESLYFWKF